MSAGALHAAPDLLDAIEQRLALLVLRGLVHLLGFSTLASTATPPRPALPCCASAARGSAGMWEDPNKQAAEFGALSYIAAACRRPRRARVRTRRPLCSGGSGWNLKEDGEDFGSLHLEFWTPHCDRPLSTLGCSSEVSEPSDMTSTRELQQRRSGDPSASSRLRSNAWKPMIMQGLGF